MARILLIDDDPLLIRMYHTKLTSDGHSVEVAEDGEMGLKLAKAGKPDLILLDVMMPKLDGLSTLKQLKVDPSTKKIPVIMLTNVSSSRADANRGLELGAVAYLVKAHYTPKEIVQKIKEILRGYTDDVPQVKTKIKD